MITTIIAVVGAVVALAAAVVTVLFARTSALMTRARSAGCGGPFVCPYPPAAEHRGGARWRCPSCRVVYVLTRTPQPVSGHGYWRISWRQGGRGE